MTSRSGPRWSVEQVEAAAPSPATVTAARPVANHARWGAPAADDRAVWGSYAGGGAEPYEVVVDHVEVAFRCSCPSRRRPCKHAIALLLLWARGEIGAGVPPPRARQWLSTRRDRSTAEPPREDDPGADGERRSETPSPDPDERPPQPPDDERDRARDERVERMLAGLVELDRWLDDRIRTGLADPALAKYATWDDLAARLVDARAGSLANRIRRLAGLVGASPDWHDRVLQELGLLHLLSQAGRRLGTLPAPLADSVATTVGWQVRSADVLAGVPDTDQWVVAGRSDTREDRIEVRRHWLRGSQSGRWALLLSFAAYRQSLDTSWRVGTGVELDLHRYPGPALRSLPGRRHSEPVPARPPASDIRGACEEIGRMLVAEPWLDRAPATVRAAITTAEGGWALTDPTGSLPVLAGAGPNGRPADGATTLLALSAGEPLDITIEWTPQGVVPLAVHLEHTSIDIGPRADASFVQAA